jgi:apolipoprotein N-acyltransferase
VALLGDFTHPGLAALAPYLGTYGLSGLTALLAGIVGEGLRLSRHHTKRPQSLALAAAPLALTAAALLLPTPAPAPGHIPYTVIQPNIAQEDLDDPAHYDRQFLDSAKLSAPQPSATYRPGQPRLVLWPESGVQDFLRDGAPAWAYQYTFAGDPWIARLRLAHVVGQGGLLLGGSEYLDITGNEVSGGQVVVAGVDDRGRLAASYAKSHLVPFGEYLPWRATLKPLGIERLVPGDMDFRPGPGPQTLNLGPLGKAGVQICYEIIFPGAVTDRTTRADYIFNPTNDGWFGAWGPPQHLAQARLRAIEEGLPVLRSTTNGISAVIDARGIIRQSAPRGVSARLDGLIPAALPLTLFARHGNIVPLGVATLLLAACALVLRLRRR